jgi:hypothetical protein
VHAHDLKDRKDIRLFDEVPQPRAVKLGRDLEDGFTRLAGAGASETRVRGEGREPVRTSDLEDVAVRFRVP